MHKLLAILLSIVLFIPLQAQASYSKQLCEDERFNCMKITQGSWGSLFPDPEQREFVMRLNRTNTELYRGRVIAVPKDMSNLDIMAFAPLAREIPATGQKKLVVKLSQLAWGAYDEEGQLLRWGPISGGKKFCPDVGASCHTVTGDFNVYHKLGPGCYSSKYPLPDGGAPMPYCMYFHGGYALHAGQLPGYPASHGCVRLFYEDAQWLNQEFVNAARGTGQGTRVVVEK